MKSQVLGDRYHVRQQLGKNAGRRTLLACDLNTQELVIVKLLSFSSDFEWQHLKLFEREAETLKTISHPAIPSYLNYFEIDSPKGKSFALVQTYVEGRSLLEHLKQGRTFTEAEVKQIAKDLLEILIYLHGRYPPIIHRDIKPSNILLTNRDDSDGEVYLVDFGSVQNIAATEGGTMTVVGTYGYMPLEQFGGRTVPASDLYSLGASLITLVTGTHPADLPQKDGRFEFEQVANLSPAFTNWLKWMTEPIVDRRSSSAMEARQALEQPQQPDTTLSVVRRPPGSKISLTEEANSLNLLIPAKGLNSAPGLKFLIALFYIPTAVILLPSLGNWLPILPNWMETIIFLVIMFSIALAPTLAQFLSAEVFTRVQLRINQQKFFFNSNRSVQGLRQAIAHLEYIKRSFTKGRRGKLQSQIIIWIGGTQTITLGDKGRITEADLDWLAYKLSDWLKLPVTRE